MGGTKLAEVTFTGETASGWQTAAFPTPAAIQSNTTYIISCYVADGNRRFSDTFDFFATTGVDNPPLHALAAGVDGPNAVFGENGAWFNNSYRSSCYWVDLIFSTDAPPADTTPPVVSSVTPTNGAIGILITAPLTVAFNEAMDAATINTDTIELRDPSNNLVPATVGYDAISYTVTLTPGANLAKSTTYTARVKSGDSGVKDVAGNAIASDYTWSFTTEIPDAIPPTVTSVSPVNAATGVRVGSNAWVIFSEAMDPGSISTATIELRDPSDNPVSASVSYYPGSYTATLTPGANLAYNATYTAHIKSGASGVKDVAGNALEADYTWSFTTETPDTTPPTVSSVMPINGVTRLRLATRATVHFSEAMDASSISTATIELRDPSDNLVSASVSYDAGSNTATLTPGANLACSTIYTARVKGGANGVRDAFNNAMTADYVWSFGTVSQRLPVDQALGGPILIVASSTNLYTRYFTEILRTEGLNEFDIVDIMELTAGILDAHDVVILGDMALTAGQVTMLADWVTAGGHLIAMRPDKQLVGLLGLTDAQAAVQNGYLLFDNSAGKPGAGIVYQTLQIHGDADAFVLSGATALATLYSDRSTPTTYPAVTLQAVGTNGGAACAFAFDLARSIVLTHQGDPTKGGGGSYQVQPLFVGWVDSSRLAIPQADEQQRFLANLILSMNADKRPLPRFWYLPKGKKAAIILTGDDHWGRSTPGGSSSVFFERHKAQSPPGGSVEDWECIRSSSYGYPGCLMTDAQAAAYAAEGFEFGVHADAGLASGGGWCGMWPSDTAVQYAAQLSTRLMRNTRACPSRAASVITVTRGSAMMGPQAGSATPASRRWKRSLGSGSTSMFPTTLARLGGRSSATRGGP
jgi:hypothetical protein